MTIATELERLEQEMWRANREGDGGFYERVVRDDALVVSRHGVAGKADIVPIVTRNERPFVQTELTDLKVLQISGDSALVTYKATVTALVDDAEERSQVLATSVYAREGDQWRSVFHQQTEV
jgi:ketosteroid isomerase-like protein